MHRAHFSIAFAARARGARGFTLVELKVSMAIGVFILAGVVSTYLGSIKGFRAIANYTEIHSDAREAVNYFAKDMRAVSGISSFNGSNITVKIPTAFGSTGLVISNKTVSYTYNRKALYRFDSSTGNTAMLATNIYYLKYSLYDHLGTSTTLTNVAKSVAVDIKLCKLVLGKTNSEDYISARMDMRNKP